jgi:hypothetical protein
MAIGNLECHGLGPRLWPVAGRAAGGWVAQPHALVSPVDVLDRQPTKGSTRGR